MRSFKSATFFGMGIGIDFHVHVVISMQADAYIHVCASMSRPKNNFGHHS